MNLKELDKLEIYLFRNGYRYKRIDEECPRELIGIRGRFNLDKDYGEVHQIIVYDKKRNKRLWDAICQWGSYGYSQGLLEVMGSPVVKKEDNDRVCGYLTAQDVINRLEQIL